MSSTEIINRLHRKDQLAFKEVYNRYWETLMFHATRMLGEEEDALDVVQDVFCTLWEKADTLNIHENLGGYLFSMVRFRVLNKLRHHKAGEKFISGMSGVLETSHEGVLDHLYCKDLSEALQEEIDKLPTKMRDVFLLSRQEYLSYKEISNQLGIADTTVKKQINNALKILRFRLERMLFLLF